MWKTMEGDIREFGCGCLYCANYRAGRLVPWSLSDTVHSIKVGGVVYLVFPYSGTSEVAVEVDTRDEFGYVRAILEDMNSYVWLRPGHAYTANFVAIELVTCCRVFGIPKTSQ